jgi:hypothetical protein
MQSYEPYSGLGVHWMTFGSSGHKDRPAGGVLANYVACMPADAAINRCALVRGRAAGGGLHCTAPHRRARGSGLPHQRSGHSSARSPPAPHLTRAGGRGCRHIKTIANTQYLAHVGPDPHTFSYEPGCPPVVNQDATPITGAVIHGQPISHSKIALYHYLVKSDADFRAKMRRGSGDGGRKNSTLQNAVNKQSTSICSFGVSLGLMCCPSTLEGRNQSASQQQIEQQAAAAVMEPAARGVADRAY